MIHRTCRTAMLVEIPCTANLSVKKPSRLILAECRHIDDRPAKQLAAQNIETKEASARRECVTNNDGRVLERTGMHGNPCVTAQAESLAYERWISASQPTSCLRLYTLLACGAAVQSWTRPETNRKLALKVRLWKRCCCGWCALKDAQHRSLIGSIGSGFKRLLA